MIAKTYILLVFIVITHQQFFADKTKDAINEIFSGNYIKILKSPLYDEITLKAFEIKEFKFQKSQKNESYHSQLLVFAHVDIGGFIQLKSQIKVEARFSINDQLIYEEGRFDILSIDNRFISFRKQQIVNYANLFLKKFEGKSLPLPFTWPTYLKLDQGKNKGIIFDYEGYIQQRKKQTGWKSPQELEQEKVQEQQM